jgi:hypothetical protein
MNKIIYFHCGLPKTGTKAIQQYLTIKAEDGEGNFLYPESGRLGSSIKSHFDLSNPGSFYKMGLGGGNYEISDAGTLYEVLLSEISSSNVKKIIISSESFGQTYNRPPVPAILRTFVESARSDGDEVKCVVYLRNFVEWIKSLHLLFCRMRDDIDFCAANFPPWVGVDFEKFLLERNLRENPSGQIRHLASIFSRKDLIIRYYEGDVVEDFCKVVGIEFGGRKIVANKTKEKYEVLRGSLLADNTRKIIRERFQESESKFADEFLTKEQRSKYLEGLSSE